MVEYDAQLETSTPAHLFCTIIELAFHCYELFVKWSLLTVASRGSIPSHSGAHNNDDCFNIYWDWRGGGRRGGEGRGWVAERAGHSHKTVSVDGDLQEQERNMIIHVLLPTARELLVTSTFMMVS